MTKRCNYKKAECPNAEKDDDNNSISLAAASSASVALNVVLVFISRLISSAHGQLC